jgi:hypothetical protein
LEPADIRDRGQDHTYEWLSEGAEQNFTDSEGDKEGQMMKMQFDEYQNEYLEDDVKRF